MQKYLNKIIEGDCFDVLANFPSACIDLVLCDLPYGTTNNLWDEPLDLVKLWELYKYVIKPDGVILLTAQGLFTGQLIMSKPELFKYKMVWVKSIATNFLNVNKQPLRKHEDICVFYEKQVHYYPQMKVGQPYNKGMRRNVTPSYNEYKSSLAKNDSGKRYPGDVLFFEDEAIRDVIYIKSSRSMENNLHPTQKPVSLARYLIRTFSKKSAIVLDNACGSGSFLEAAVLENRSFIGIEKNRVISLSKTKTVDIINIAQRRVDAAFKKRELF